MFLPLCVSPLVTRSESDLLLMLGKAKSLYFWPHAVGSDVSPCTGVSRGRKSRRPSSRRRRNSWGEKFDEIAEQNGCDRRRSVQVRRIQAQMESRSCGATPEPSRRPLRCRTSRPPGVSSTTDGQGQRLVTVDVVKGPSGFGFTLADTEQGQWMRVPVRSRENGPETNGWGWNVDPWI